ncbi:MAG: hypothetical protein PWQ48_1509 [Thermotogaceae bacterium]|jgi:uncharacterized 2Fe-2S/4Fe-4S cluster protein (DUF4445 family)|nr:hypothetical protein [Thermotogaceae bacterium]
MPTHLITLVNYGMDIETSENNLLDALVKSGINIPAYCSGRGICGKCKLKFVEPIPSPTLVERKLLKDEEIEKGIRLACQHTLTTNVRLEISENFNFDTFIKVNKNYKRTGKFLDLAVDLGTTTIYIKAIDYTNKEWFFEAMCLNPLIMFGSDVISRITWIMQKNKGRFFSNILFEKISSLLTTSISRLGLNPQIRKMVIVGNNPMMHILLNLDVSKLALAPYDSPYLHEPITVNSREYGFKDKFDILIPPSVEGFIGSDLLAVLYFLKDFLFKKNGAMIDLGTNGELGLWNEESLFVTSTAAGPAFEGMKIAHGMVAIDGAIKSFRIDRSFIIKTVNNKKPKGICGSGLIDIIAEFLKSDFIKRSGRINTDFSFKNDRITVFNDSTEPIYLYQKDIREFQLSKAAVSTAFKILLLESKITLNDIEKIFLAGNFGSTLNLENAMVVGLLPKVNKEKFKFIGNAALEGAVKLCLDEISGFKFLRNLRKNLKHVRLENDRRFFEMFIEAMSF